MGEDSYEQVTALIPLEERMALEAKAAKAEEYLNAARRAQADFVNYQDRMKQERENLRKYGIEQFARELLPSLDDVRKAIEVAAKDRGGKTIHDALVLIERNMLGALAKQGITRLEARGRAFDPAEHDAVMMIERKDLEPNMVVDVLRDGYAIHDRILRPAQVSVSRKPA